MSHLKEAGREEQTSPKITERRKLLIKIRAKINATENRKKKTEAKLGSLERSTN